MKDPESLPGTVRWPNYIVDSAKAPRPESGMARTTPRARSDCCSGEIEVTPKMIEAGEEIILIETGGGSFSAADLASRVFLAMAEIRKSTHG